MKFLNLIAFLIAFFVYQSSYGQDVEIINQYNLRSKSTTQSIDSNRKIIPFNHQNAALNSFCDTLSRTLRKLKTISGYRILVYSGNERELALKAKKRIYQVFGDINIYTNYQQPTFKVKFGDFYERLQAQRALNKLSSEYPNSVIIAETVNIIR